MTGSKDANLDALSAAEREALFTSIENVRHAVAQQLSAHRGSAFPIAFIENLQRGVDSVVQAAIDRGVKIECKAGCSYCCSAKVEATAPEVFRIARAVLRLPTEEVAEWVQTLRQHVQITDGQSEWHNRKPCPFLVNHLCSVYEIRPSTCRKAHSLNVRNCESSAKDIPQSLDIVVAAEALMRGTADAYHQSGLDATRHELVNAVLRAITDPDMESRWLNGEPCSST
ncbi:MAG: YkgJ family cysteine cluster protein [Thiobacillus sp.]|nr:YkgJ family cysteine cluster protein [Thiobacillus sp.]